MSVNDNSGFGACRLLEQGHGWHALTAELWFEHASCPEQPGRETGISGGGKSKRKCGNPVFLIEEAHLRIWNGLLCKYKYGLFIEFLESLSCWFNYKCTFFFFFWRGEFVWSIFDKSGWSFLWTPSGLQSRDIVNKPKSRCKLKTLWDSQGRRCWNRDRPSTTEGFWNSHVVIVSWARGTIKSVRDLALLPEG